MQDAKTMMTQIRLESTNCDNNKLLINRIYDLNQFFVFFENILSGQEIAFNFSKVPPRDDT